MKSEQNNELLNSSINQLCLYNYEKYFDLFIKLHKSNNLPKSILISGLSGIGKSTFVFHFINFLLSHGEEFKYSLDNYEINKSNKSFRLLSNSVHPNFYLVESKNSKKNIEIDQIRKMISFLSKTTFDKGLKIVFVKDAELLNKNAANALLKILEEPDPNTFFFIIQNNSSFLVETIRSRCLHFNIFLDHATKKSILLKLIEQYNLQILNINLILDKLTYFTPGNLLKYLSIYSELDDLNKFNLYDSIIFFIDRYLTKKNYEDLNTVFFLIEHFYHSLYMNNSHNINIYLNKNKILGKLNFMKRFNLDEENIFTEIKNILSNEKR